jgi:hypothetical protein
MDTICGRADQYTAEAVAASTMMKARKYDPPEPE